MKTLSDNDIDKIIKSEFNCQHNHPNLCLAFMWTKYDKKWSEYWEKINNQKKFMVEGYMRGNYEEPKSCLLRLLIVEDFKRYINEIN